MKGAIMLSGGGTGKLFAAIGVTYPVGSTVTCTNGTKTLKAKNTSGQWVFAIPETGTWTVTATDGTNTSRKFVEIIFEGQSVSVNLAYRTEGYLYNAGVFNEDYQHEELKNTKCTITYNESDIFFKSTAESTAYGFVVFKDVIFNGQSAIIINRTSTGSGQAKNGSTIAVMDDYTNWTPTETSEGTLAYFYESSDDDPVEGPADCLLNVSNVTPGVYDVAVGFSTQGSKWTASRSIYMHYIKIE